MFILCAPREERLFDRALQQALFDRMVLSYERVNLLTSFGLCEVWRRGCAQGATGKVLDLMAGSGELWPYLADATDITAVDFSSVSCVRARAATATSVAPVMVLEADALASDLSTAAFDTVVCGFGVKTLSEEQKGRFAREVARLLRPGGQCRLTEITVPRNVLWRTAFLAYLRFVIPLAGRLLLGDPACYRMLYQYTVVSRNLDSLAVALEDAGLVVETTSLVGGGATLLTGRKKEGNEHECS